MVYWFAHALYSAVIIWLGLRNVELANIIQAIHTLSPATVTVTALDNLMLLPAPPMLAPHIPPDFCINTFDSFYIIEGAFAPLPKRREVVKVKEVIKIRVVKEVKHHYYESPTPPTPTSYWYEDPLIGYALWSCLSCLVLTSCMVLWNVWKTGPKKRAEVSKTHPTFPNVTHRRPITRKAANRPSLDPEYRVSKHISADKKKENQRDIDTEKAVLTAKHEAYIFLLKTEYEERLYKRGDELADALTKLAEYEANRNQSSMITQNSYNQLNRDLELATLRSDFLSTQMDELLGRISDLEQQLSNRQAKTHADIEDSVNEDVDTNTPLQNAVNTQATEDTAATVTHEDEASLQVGLDDDCRTTQNSNGAEETTASVPNSESGLNHPPEQSPTSPTRERILHLPDHIIHGKDDLGIKLPALARVADELPVRFEPRRNERSRIVQYNRTQMRVYSTRRYRVETARQHTVQLHLRWDVTMEEDGHEHCRIIGASVDANTGSETAIHSYEEFIELVRSNTTPPPEAPTDSADMAPVGAPRGSAAASHVSRPHTFAGTPTGPSASTPGQRANGQRSATRGRGSHLGRQ